MHTNEVSLKKAIQRSFNWMPVAGVVAGFRGIFNVALSWHIKVDASGSLYGLYIFHPSSAPLVAQW